MMSSQKITVFLFLLIWAQFSFSAPISGQGTWETTLQARDLDGDNTTAEAYYDTVLDITWHANPNIFGAGNWFFLKEEIETLDINGINNWRLPDTNPINSISYNFTPTFDGSTDQGSNISATETIYEGSTGSEMAHLFYNTFGNIGRVDTNGVFLPEGGLRNTGPFQETLFEAAFVWDGRYWSIESPIQDNPDPIERSSAIIFGLNTGGGQSRIDKPSRARGWAVHDGDVGNAVVPIPAAVWLFGSALIGLVGLKRKS